MNCLANALLDSSRAASRVGPKIRYPRSLERIHHAQRERQLGAHNGQAGLLFLGQPHHGVYVFQIHRNAARHLGNAAIARSAHDLGDALAAAHCPRQRMFASARTQNQNFHSIAFHCFCLKPEEQWSAIGRREVKRLFDPMLVNCLNLQSRFKSRLEILKHVAPSEG